MCVYSGYNSYFNRKFQIILNSRLFIIYGNNSSECRMLPYSQSGGIG